MSEIPIAALLAAMACASCVASVATAARGSIVDRFAPPEGADASAGRRFLGALGRSRLGRRIRRGRLDERLAAARSTWTPDEVAGAKVAALACVVPVVAAPTPLGVVGVPIALIAFRMPDIVLSRAARTWRRAASGEIPLLLDLLAVTTSAGIAPQIAVRVAVEQVRGPLGDELRRALGRADLGRRWRDELTAVAERLGLRDLHRVVALVRRTETLGASTAGEIARLASDVRSERRARAAERARTAPVKMLFPLVFLILPAFLLLTVVPVLLTTVRSIH
jgi:Flp pilus assembly protein TadB